jgi:nicotinamide-nucleotide amidase
MRSGSRGAWRTVDRSERRVDGGVQSIVEQQQDVRDRLAAQVADLARARGRTVAVAESLTGGMVATALAAAEAASEWFRGSLVAYSSEVKHEVLGVPDGPVVSAVAATAMARGARRLLGADVAVAVTGAGGPAAQDGQEPGTVFLAVYDGVDARVQRLDLDGDDPEAVCAAAARSVLEVLVDRLRP